MKTALALLILIAAGCGYYFLYPPMALKHKTESALEAFSKAVESQDRAKVAASLDKYLSPIAKIHLEMTFYSVLQQEGTKPQVQDFDPATFKQFIDNLLYSTTDYHYAPQLREFTLSKDHKSANVTFISSEYADATSYYDGKPVGMRYSSTTSCAGEVLFEQNMALLDTATCAVQAHLVPKVDEAYKLRQSPEALQQYLKQ